MFIISRYSNEYEKQACYESTQRMCFSRIHTMLQKEFYSLYYIYIYKMIEVSCSSCLTTISLVILRWHTCRRTLSFHLYLMINNTPGEMYDAKVRCMLKRSIWQKRGSRELTVIVVMIIPGFGCIVNMPKVSGVYCCAIPQ